MLYLPLRTVGAIPAEQGLDGSNTLDYKDEDGMKPVVIAGSITYTTTNLEASANLL